MINRLLNIPSLVCNSTEKERMSFVEKQLGVDFPSLSNDPDTFFLDASKDTGIEQIRKMQNFLSLKPYQREEKIIFVKEAQNLTPEAQNCLLKTLEEPVGKAQIYLTAPSPSWLLPTIVSRCQIVQLPTRGRAVDKKNCAREEELLQNLLSANIPERFIILEKENIYKDRETAVSWVELMIVVSRKLLLENFLSARRYLFLLSHLTRTRSLLKANCNVRLALENLLLQLDLASPPCYN